MNKLGGGAGGDEGEVEYGPDAVGDSGDGGSCGGGGGDGAYTASETTSLTPSGSYTTAQPQTIVCISVP